MSAPDPVFDRLAAAAATAVPDGASWPDVQAWLHGLDPGRAGAADAATVDRHIRTLDTVRLVATSEFWQDDPGLLAAACTGVAGALWQLAGPCALDARGGPDGLSLGWSAAPDRAEALARVTAGFLPGVRLAAAGPRPVDEPGAPAVALWGAPPPVVAPASASVVDRLAQLVATRWHLRVLLVPVPVAHLVQRARMLGDLAAAVAAHGHRQVVLDPVHTAQVDDPEAELLLAGVRAEQARVDQALASGAWVALARLSAPTDAELAAAVGAATAAAVPATTAPAVPPARPWRPVAGPVVPPALLLSSEVGEVLRPPLSDRHGLPVRRWVSLHSHLEPLGHGGPGIRLGDTVDGVPVVLPLRALTSHLLLTGSPGSGKSTTGASLLGRLAVAGVPFMVVEPVKREYRGLPVADVVVWSPGSPDPGPDWVCNPLEVPRGVPVQTHVEGLVTLFRATFGLAMPLPLLLELALHRVYEARGWDLATDSPPAGWSGDEWPTLSELVEVAAGLPAEIGYAHQIRSDLRAALLARLGSLTRGPKARVLDRDRPFPTAQVLGSNVVVNLDDIGDDEVRAFVMGLLLLRLREERRTSVGGELVHVLVLEEAHRLLGATGGPRGGSGAEGAADAAGHTASALGDLLAEIRSSGQAVVVVDQSPSALVSQVVANTSTKVALRADGRDDQLVLGAAMGLRPGEEHVLGGLGRHEALVSWEGMDVPVRVLLDHAFMRDMGPVAVPRRAPATRIAHPSVALRAAVATLLRVEPPADAPVRSRVLALARAELGPAGEAAVGAAVVDLVTAEVDAVGRARRWPAAHRAAAVAAVLAGRAGPDHPSALLVDGRQRVPACAAVCPAGGCLLGEVAAPQAEHLAAEGPATRVRLVADAEERSRRVARRALEVVDPGAPPDLRRLAARCLTALYLDDWADPVTVGALVDATPPAPPGPPGGAGGARRG